jgi:hypothetical protein
MKKLFLLLALLSFQFCKPIHQHPQCTPHAYVAFATQNYFSILKVTLDSHKEFSKQPFIVYGINADIPFSTQEYPLLIKRRMDVDLTQEHIFYVKPKVIYHANITNGVYIEADDVLNENVDTLFEICPIVKNIPFCPIHPQDPQNQQAVMQAMEVIAKTTPYVHAAHVIFTSSCLPFIQEWYQNCLAFGHLGQNYDETVLNVLLWKHKATECVGAFDPYYGSLQAYLQGRLPTEHGYTPAHHVSFHTLHGCKDAQQSAEIFQVLKELSLQKRQNNKR